MPDDYESSSVSYQPTQKSSEEEEEEEEEEEGEENDDGEEEAAGVKKTNRPPVIRGKPATFPPNELLVLQQRWARTGAIYPKAYVGCRSYSDMGSYAKVVDEEDKAAKLEVRGIYKIYIMRLTTVPPHESARAKAAIRVYVGCSRRPPEKRLRDVHNNLLAEYKNHRTRHGAPNWALAFVIFIPKVFSVKKSNVKVLLRHLKKARTYESKIKRAIEVCNMFKFKCHKF